MNFTGLNALNQHSPGGTRLLSEGELMGIIKLLDTLPPGATLQSVLATNSAHPVVPILLALNPNQLQQIQQYMAARMRQLSQQFLQPQLLQQVQTQQNVQPKRIVTIQPKQSVLVPPQPDIRSNVELKDWVCTEGNCRALNIGWRAACSECGAPRPGTVDQYAPRAEQYTGQQMMETNNGYEEPNYNQQPYQERQYNNGPDSSHQELMPAYENMQPSDDYPLEPLGVDVDAPVDDDPNDMEVETFDNAASSIISVRKVVESPIKQRPPSQVVNARASALIPPLMPKQYQHVSYYRDASPPQIEPEQQIQSNNYYDDNQYNSPIERPPVSPVLADQEQSDGYDYGNAYHEENQHQESNGHHQDEHKKYKKRDKDEPLVMSDRTIYVKNIVTVDEEELEKIFRTAGSIRDIRMKRDSNAPTRSAFIEYWNKDDAKVAYDTLHGVSLAGKRLQVGWAVARFSGKPLNKPSKSLFLGNLPNELTENMIRQLVAPHGTVIGVKKIYQFGEFRGCAFVDFARVEDAQKALYAVHRTVHMGKRIRADFSSTGQERGSDYIPGLDINQDRDPRPARDYNKDPRDDYRRHETKPVSPEPRAEKSCSSDQPKSTPTKITEKVPAPSIANISKDSKSKKPLTMVATSPKPPKVKMYWSPTRNLSEYIEAIRVSKGSSGLMSTVIEKRGVCYKSLNSKGDFTDIKLYLEGPKRKVDEFFNFVASCKAGTVDKEIVYPTFIISRGHADIAHLNWESPYVLGPRSENVSFLGVSFKKGSANYPSMGKQTANPVVTVVVDPSEAELYRKSMPNVLLLILPESNRPLSYARHVVKRMAEGADCDGTSIELPFFWLCDDNLVQFSKLEHVQGQNTKQRKTADEMFKEAFLYAQGREDINDYGLVGFVRYHDTAASKTTDEAKNKSSLTKCVLVNVNKTRGSNYIPGLKKFEEVAFALRLKKDNVPTLKLFNYCFRAVTLQQDYNEAKERSDYTGVEQIKDTSIDVDELLDEGYEPRTAAEIEDISALKDWIVKQEAKGKLTVVARPQPKPVPQLETRRPSSNDLAESPLMSRRPNKIAATPSQQKQKSSADVSPTKPQGSASGADVSTLVPTVTDNVDVNNDNMLQEDEKEESSVIGKELVFPDVDPEELAKPAKKRRIIDEYSSSSESSESSSDSEDSIEQPGTTRIKSMNEQKKKEESIAKETINNQPAVEVTTQLSISEAAKLREKRPSAVAAVQAITTPPKKKTPLKGAAVKAPAPPKEKKSTKSTETSAQDGEDKSVTKRGTKRKADEMSQSESDASAAVNDEPVRKRSRAKPVGPDGRRHYCHQCRQPRAYEDVIYCSKSSDGGCKNNRGWCAGCLKNRYGLNMEELRDKEWTCPMCLGHCNCSTCRVLSGKKPTGALTIDAVKSLGFESVHHYLVSNDDEKVVTAIKEAASKKKAEKKAKEAAAPNNTNVTASQVADNTSATDNNYLPNNDNTKSGDENKIELPAGEKQEVEQTKEKRVQPTRTSTGAKRGRKRSSAPLIERDIEPIVIDDEGEEYVVDKIYLKRKNVNTELVQFLVKWHGFPLTLCTWVNLADMFCGDMLHDFEVAWNAKRERIEAAAKKKPKVKELPAPSESTDASKAVNNTNTATPMSEENITALNRSMQLTQTQDEIPLNASQASLVPPTQVPEAQTPMDTDAAGTEATETTVPSASSDQAAMQVDAPVQESSAAQLPERQAQLDNQSEFIQSVISTTNLSPEEALMLSEIATQVINEAIGESQVSVDDSMAIDAQQPREQLTEPNIAPQEQQPMETEAQQHPVADQAQSAVEPNVTNDDAKQMEVVEQSALDNQNEVVQEIGQVQQTSEEGALQVSENNMADNEQHTVADQAQSVVDSVVPMQTEGDQQRATEAENQSNTAESLLVEAAQLSMDHAAQQDTSVAAEQNAPTTIESLMSEAAPIIATNSVTEVLHNPATATMTNTEQAPIVNNETSPSAATAPGALVTEVASVQNVPALPKEGTSSPATSPSQLKFSMAELSRARSERIKRSESEVLAPIASDTAVTPTKQSTEQTKDQPSNVEPTSPVAPTVTPVKPSSRKQSAKKPIPVKEVSNSEVTPVKLDPNDVTGETDPNEFDVGMKVWVKLTGYKWWPGQIVAKLSNDSFLVIFYSAESFKEVCLSDPDTKMVLFEGYLDILGPLTSKKALKEAVAQQHDWHLYSEDQKKKKKKPGRKKKW